MDKGKSKEERGKWWRYLSLNGDFQYQKVSHLLPKFICFQLFVVLMEQKFMADPKWHSDLNKLRYWQYFFSKHLYSKINHAGNYIQLLQYLHIFRNTVPLKSSISGKYNGWIWVHEKMKLMQRHNGEHSKEVEPHEPRQEERQLNKRSANTKH
jgi:hypothetical protein